jgi:uncharacterized protein (TIGR01244 family)
MMAEDTNEPLNYRVLSNRLITSGQPDEEQLAQVAAIGISTVVNLASDDEWYTLEDEPGTVAALGMSYYHIPVIWQAPALSDLEQFMALMDRLADQPVFVHCTANKRVSTFIFLYRIIRLHWPPAGAVPDLLAVWQPNPNWIAFIRSVWVAYDLPPSELPSFEQ